MLGSTGGISYATFANQLRSYTKHRVLKRQEFITSDYSSDTVGPFTSRVKFQLGNEYTDTRSSFLQFDMTMRFATKKLSTKLKFEIDPHPISFIKRLTVYDAHGKVLTQVDRLNKVMVQHLEATKDLYYLLQQND